MNHEFLPIHRIVETWASTHPEHLVLLQDERHLSYHALNRRANQLARYLQQHGVTSGEIVAICLEHSIDFIVATLAILKVGAAYLPLEPSWPDAEKHRLIQDAQTRLVITEQSWPQSPCPLISPTLLALLLHQQSPENLEIDVLPTHLCSMLYNSGSTGTPKGVLVPYGGVVRLVADTEHFPVHQTDRVAHSSSVAFDTSTFENWLALLNGASLIILEHNTVLAPQRYQLALLLHQISLLPTGCATRCNSSVM